MGQTVIVVFAAAVLIWAAWVFNRLVGLRNRALGSWSDVDVQLKRRHDLVGNLVRTVEGYASHERTTLEQVTRARAQAEGARDAADPRRAGEAETRLNGGLRQLLAVAEAYPDLKASDRFLDLQRALVDLEDDLQNARRYYNAVVRDLNTRIQYFPDLIVARLLRFRERDFFELDSAVEAIAPQVRQERAP